MSCGFHRRDQSNPCKIHEVILFSRLTTSASSKSGVRRAAVNPILMYRETPQKKCRYSFPVSALCPNTMVGWFVFSFRMHALPPVEHNNVLRQCTNWAPRLLSQEVKATGPLSGYHDGLFWSFTPTSLSLEAILGRGPEFETPNTVRCYQCLLKGTVHPLVNFSSAQSGRWRRRSAEP